VDRVAVAVREDGLGDAVEGRPVPHVSIAGTDIYTDDSALATAVVHAGVLAVGQTGVVRVTILGGQASYAGTTRNGVTSGASTNFPGSYRVERARVRGNRRLERKE
jgi:hypothetical protein